MDMINHLKSTIEKLRKVIPRVALAVLPVTLTLLLAPRPSTSAGQPAPVIGVTVPEITAAGILDVSEADFRVTGTALGTQERTAWPDGHSSVWVMIPGRITAGVDLSDMKVSREGNTLRVEMPSPEVTSAIPDYGEIDWGHYVNFWTDDPDGTALDLRDSLLRNASSALHERAIVSGLLEEAAVDVQTTILSFANALGIDRISISTTHGRTIPVGFDD
ncbi:MAG TPA: DUF4230 domain-containing protein [Candidatus Fermentibacter daniensis]|nr:DUF4230 domain-containing protein [Candidatus Fermentibacter daniensis]